MKRNFFLFVWLSLVLLNGCSTTGSTMIEHVEAYTMENLTDEPTSEGFYEENGYRKVNSIIHIEESRRSPKQIKVYEVIDYHNIDGKFVYSIIRYSDTNNNSKQKIESKPLTILTTDQIPSSPPKELTVEEKKQVKDHILNLTATYLNKENKK